MKRNHLVIVVVIVALGLMAWAGVTNYRRRKQEQAKLMDMQSMLVQASRSSSCRRQTMHRSRIRWRTTGSRLHAKDTTGKKVSLADYKGKASCSISGRHGARRAK